MFKTVVGYINANKKNNNNKTSVFVDWLTNPICLQY